MLISCRTERVRRRRGDRRSHYQSGRGGSLLLASYSLPSLVWSGVGEGRVSVRRSVLGRCTDSAGCAHVSGTHEATHVAPVPHARALLLLNYLSYRWNARQRATKGTGAGEQAYTHVRAELEGQKGFGWGDGTVQAHPSKPWLQNRTTNPGRS